MPGRPALAALAIAAVALPAPALANAYAFPIDIRPKPLAAALQELARQTGIELLYDRQLVRGVRAPAVKGRMTVDAALARLLDGSDLVARRASSGAWLIARRPPAPEAVVMEAVEGPELLVSGRLTQNVDIRRRENDVQPYQVSSGDDVRRAHRDDVDQYFRSRVTANTQVIPPSLSFGGSNHSEIDLRGLGSQYTLVLIDGRRVPSNVAYEKFFAQSDVNAIPLHAIDRIETLTGTASGIHGFGALGGVTNVVLRRDFKGLELHATSGISSRGDARRLAIEAGLGVSPDDGRTELTLFLGRAWNEPLTDAQRGYTHRARRNANRFDPVTMRQWMPVTDSVGVFGFFDGDPLVFKPEYGGAALGADHSFLPKGLSGSPAEVTAALIRNAGRIDDRPSSNEEMNQLGTNAETTSLMFSLRRRFGGFEAYVDGLVLRNRGRSVVRESSGDLVLFPDDAINPFQNFVWLTFPANPANERYRTSHGSDRYTLGVIAPLPSGWKGTAEASFGSSYYNFGGIREGIYLGPLFLDGTEGPDFNPFGDWDAFQRSLAPQQVTSSRFDRANGHFRAQSLRLAGPLFRLAAAPATATVALENVREKVLGYNYTFNSPLEPEPIIDLYDDHSSKTRSLYAEVRAPIADQSARNPLLRGLELQLAVRHDRQALRFTDRGLATPDERRHARFASTSFTFGAKLLPTPWLMLRGSYATGHQPPQLEYLTGADSLRGFSFVADPKRGNRLITDDGPYVVRLLGSPDLKAVRANTLSVGAVLNPLGDAGPRFSLDFSRIRRTGDFTSLNENLVLAREDQWPERVVREPLSDADRAQGFTAGRITMIDARGMNGGRLAVDTLDGRLDWTVPFAGESLRTYGSATWQFRNRIMPLFDAEQERTGFANGPLRLRANGGGEWSIGRTMVGVNVQYFSRYANANSQYPDSDLADGTQGTRWISAQTFVDLYASRLFEIGLAGKAREVRIDLGIVNLLDRAPAYRANSFSLGQQYSFYGDPRRRRFELTLSAAF